MQKISFYDMQKLQALIKKAKEFTIFRHKKQTMQAIKINFCYIWPQTIA